MQLAALVPFGKSIALGGVLLVATALVPHDRAVTHRLALHAPEEADAYYLSAWHDGDIQLTFHDGELHPITFHIRASITDGCRWLATETLDPIDGKTFAYHYSEEILACDPGAKPARKTPRSGIVTVVD
jgi:hypothetical protein